MLTSHANFVIVEATGGAQEYGELVTNQTVPADANRTGEESNQTVPQDVNQTGEESNQTAPAEANQTGETSNQTVPQDVNQTGETSNYTAPQDVNQTGEESNQTVAQEANQTGEQSNDTMEGNQSEPGTSPEPSPKPRPQLSIEMRSLNESYEVFRGQTANTSLKIENWMSQNISNISIRALTSEFNATWSSSEIIIDDLEENAEIKRDLYVTPSEEVKAGNYYVPVVAYQHENRSIDVEYVNIKVKEEVFVPKVNIKESPGTLRVAVNTSNTIPLLIENTGGENLTNLSVEVKNLNGLGKIRSSTLERLKVNETGSITLNLTSGKKAGIANTTFVLSSQEGAYSFARTQLKVVPEKGWVPPEFRVPLVASAWTLILVLYAILSRLYNLESLYVKFPFVILILGEVTIMLFLSTQYYGIRTGLLPF